MGDWYLYVDGGSPGTKLSAINRDFGVSVKKITKEHRIADGSLKRDTIAVKRVFNFSWKCLASEDANVADSGMGVDSLEAIVDATGVYVLRVPDDSSSFHEYDTLVSADSFSKKMVLHYPTSGHKYWDAGLSLEEI